MSEIRKSVWVVLVISALFVAGATVGTAAAQKEKDMPPSSEHRSAVIAGEPEAKRLLLLMDTNKDGKVSKEEWMSFMEAEFNRLDTNHDGLVNVKDMGNSQIQAVPHYYAGK